MDIVAKIRDHLRGNPDRKITIRFDPTNITILPCHCRYDPILCGEKGNKAVVIKDIEVFEGGSWNPYPSVSWLDGVTCRVTCVLVKMTNDGGFYAMSSPNGYPDETLLIAAETAGIYTETII